MDQTGYLILETGQIFTGKRFGAEGSPVGELVFTTGMTGYLETLTDPSYYGQMVVQTFPLIGNYGVIQADFESDKLHPAAYLVREWCQKPSNFRSGGDLDTLLKEHGIPGLYDINTRELTKLVRAHGVMNAMLCDTPEYGNLDAVKRYRVAAAVDAVSGQHVTECRPAHPAYKVILWDFGAKANIARELLSRGCEVITVPARYTADQILAFEPDGIMLSNGPGDPAENSGIIQQLALLCRQKIPIFGICLGHQLLALSRGAGTVKLKYGHRGANQPVRDEATGRVYITSQNHGYAVATDRLPDGARLAFTNANDGTCEGLVYEDMPAFSVQFHPEASAGPLDTGFLFDRFINRMKEAR